MVLVDDLDTRRYPPHSKEHTKLISMEFKLGQLWEEYGFIGDLVVIIHLFSFLIFLILCILAIYRLLSPCQYSWTLNTRLTSPTHQRQFQGSPSNMDHQVYWRQQFWHSSEANTRWHWPPVCYFKQNQINKSILIFHKAYLSLQHSKLSSRAGVQTMDWRWLQGPDEDGYLFPMVIHY